MPRPVVVLLAAAILAAAAGACNSNTSAGARSAGTSAAAARAAQNVDPDMKPIVAGFLHNLPADSRRISPAEVARTRPAVIDVRSDEEYARGAIAGATHVELRKLAANLALLPPQGVPVVLVCEHGHRAAIGMAVLQMLGYTGAGSIEGGMAAWRAAGLPVAIPTTAAAVAAPGAAPRVDARLQAMLDYYLTHTLQNDWGAMSVAELIEDQNLKSSAEIEEQPETFDQGKSLLVAVDERDAYAKTKAAHAAGGKLSKAINIPLRELPELLDTMPLQETVNWA